MHLIMTKQLRHFLLVFYPIEISFKLIIGTKK